MKLRKLLGDKMTDNKDETKDFNESIDELINIYKLNDTMKSDFEKILKDKIVDRVSNLYVNDMFPIPQKPQTELELIFNKMLDTEFAKKIGNRVPDLATKVLTKEFDKISDNDIDKIFSFIDNIMNDNESEIDFVDDNLKESD